MVILEENNLKEEIRDKKKKKIAICIPTYNRPKILNDICSKIMNTVDEEIFDIYIYDSSPNSDSEKILYKVLQKGNFFYFKLLSTIHSNEKLYRIYQDEGMQCRYEYLWILADYLFFSKELVDKIIEKLNEKWDFLMLDFYDPEKKGNRQYYDPNQIFFEYAWSMTLFGIMIINFETVLKSADWPYLTEKYLKEEHKNFSHIAMYFEMMLKINDLKFYHFSIDKKDVYVSKYRGNKSEYFNEFLKVWGLYWYASIHALPEYYTRKDQVIRKACVYTGSLQQRSVLALRTQGALNIKSFYECKDIWRVISTVSPLYVWRIICLPKSIVKIIEDNGSVVIYIKNKIKIKQLKCFCKKYDELYIYGAGIKAEKTADLLKKEQICYKAFVVTDLEKNRKILKEHDVISISQVKKLNSIGIIVAMNNQNKNEVIPLLRENGFRNLFLQDVV